MEGEAIHKTSPKGHTDSVQMKYKSKTGESMVQPCKELKMEQRRGGRRASPFLMYTGRKGVWPLKRPRPGSITYRTVAAGDHRSSRIHSRNSRQSFLMCSGGSSFSAFKKASLARDRMAALFLGAAFMAE